MYDLQTVLGIAHMQHEERLRDAESWRLCRISRASSRRMREGSRREPQFDAAAFWPTALKRYAAAVGN